MILFDLTKKTTTGPGSENIKEVRWSGGQCVVNGNKTGEVKEVTLKALNVADLKSRKQAILNESKADLFALLSSTPPIKFGSQYRSKLVYAEVCLS